MNTTQCHIPPVSDAIQALEAFGEAISLVARARLVSRVADGRSIETTYYHRGVGEAQLVATVMDEEDARGAFLTRFHDVEMSSVARIEGSPDDIAADVVSKLIQEINRLESFW